MLRLWGDCVASFDVGGGEEGRTIEGKGGMRWEEPGDLIEARGWHGGRRPASQPSAACP